MQIRIALAIVFTFSAFLGSGIAQDTGKITVKGRVVDDSGSGVEGVRFQSGPVTNMMGEYELEAKPGGFIYLRIEELPDGYGPPLDDRYKRPVIIPPNAKDPHQLKDMELRTTFPVSGVVVDEDGNPVEGATVRAGWEIRDRTSIHRTGQQVTSDAEGRFVIGKSPQEKIYIYACVDDMACIKPVVVEKTGDRSDVRLIVSEAGTMKLKGKISDPEGQPIVDANIAVIRRQSLPWFKDYEFGETLGEVKSGEDGTFEFPIPLYRCEYHTCKVTASGYIGDKVTALKVIETGQPADLSDFRLSPARSVRGIVVDTKGESVAGARVWAHPYKEIDPFGPTTKPVDYRNSPDSSMETGTDGKFELSGIHSDALFVFADCEEYQLSGAHIGKGAEAIQLRLPAKAREHETLNLIQVSDQSRRDAVNKVVDFVLKASNGNTTRRTTNILLDVLLLANKDRVGELVRDLNSTSAKAQWHASQGRIEDALELASTDEKPGSRIQVLMECADRAPTAEDKNALLTEAGFLAKNLSKPLTRIKNVSSIVEALLDLDEIEAASELADVIAPLAMQMDGEDGGWFTKAAAAKAIVRFDSDMAWDLVKGSKNVKGRMSGLFNQYTGNLAHELASENPDKAIELLRKLSSFSQGRYTQRVACRMASVDAEKAIELMETSDDQRYGFKTHGLATLASLLKDSHPEPSKRMLETSFASLFKKFPKDDRRIGLILNLLRHESHVRDGHSNHIWRVVERLADPNISKGLSRRDATVIRKAELLLVLAIFDIEAEAREQLCDSLFEKFENPEKRDPLFRSARDNAPAWAAMALHDPDRAIATMESFFEKTPEDSRRSIPAPWSVVANCTARQGDELVDYICGELLSVWIPGAEN